jgi:hypothetical protein
MVITEIAPVELTPMEVEANTLEEFLSTKSFLSTLSEGYFAVLMQDLRKEVWSHIDDDKTFAIAMRTNKRWRNELESHGSNSVRKESSWKTSGSPRERTGSGN